VLTVLEEANNFSFLLSGSTVLLAIAAFYVGRSLWIARRELPQCATDTKVLYLLVAPPLTLAVDLLSVTDRLFWSRWHAKRFDRRPAHRPVSAYRRPKQAQPNKQAQPKQAMRASG
jgi:hypothetical protein